MRYLGTLAVLILTFAGARTLVASAAAAPPVPAGGVVVPIAQQSNSGQTGSATLTATADGKTQVVITLSGTPNGADEPAHIHPGPCKTLNPKPAFPLSDVVDGKSTTVVNAPLASLQTGQFAINVHQSTTNIGTYVACGNIPPATPANAPSNASTPEPMMSQMPGRS
jgi:CHRD domain-containing protein